MATLQKFKLLATQCAVVASPTRSPTTSPVIHLRRRKTLRMLLGRKFHHRRDDSSPDRRRFDSDKPSASTGKDQLGVRHKLKDLFFSSPPLDESSSAKKLEEEEEAERLLPVTGQAGGGEVGLAEARGIGGGAYRPLSATIRQRLLRRAWRPVLGPIPEQSP